MSFWNEIQQSPTILSSNRSTTRNVGYVVAGIVILVLTLKSYRWITPQTSRSSLESISSADADRHIASAKNELTVHPDDYRVWTNLGLSYYAKGPQFYGEGLNALDKARSLGENNEQVFYYAGVMFDTLGLPDYAMVELSKYLRHHPEDYETQVRLANIYFRQKHADEALALYKTIVREWPKDPTVWLNYAVVNKEKGHYDVAVEAIQQVKKHAKVMPEGGFFQEGEIYRLQNQLDKAVESYRSELALHADSVPSLEALDGIARQRGDRKQSQSLRQQIITIKKQQTPPIKNG